MKEKMLKKDREKKREGRIGKIRRKSQKEG